MENYISVGAISTELGISRRTISTKIRNLGLDGRKLTENDKNLIVEACKNNLEAKKSQKAFDVKSKLIKTDTIIDKTGSTLEQRLEIAKREFDNLNKSLEECQIAIDSYGTIIINDNDNKPFSNPAVKTKCELLKQHNSLQKTIQDLEDKLKLSISSSLNDSAIDD